MKLQEHLYLLQLHLSNESTTDPTESIENRLRDENETEMKKVFYSYPSEHHSKTSPIGHLTRAIDGGNERALEHALF